MKSFSFFFRNAMFATVLVSSVFLTTACEPGTTINPSVVEDCIDFQPNDVKAEYVSGRWKVTQGAMWMYDTDQNQAEAEKIADIIKFYDMNKQCFVGRPDPSFEYLTVNGKSPEGPIAGEDCIPFDPNNISVKNVDGRWKIVEGADHWMFDFAENQAEAIAALALIKKYGFDMSCFVGRPDPSMSYLRKRSYSEKNNYTEDCVSYNPATVSVENVNGSWKVVDGSHWMYDFGSNEAEARTTYDIIKHYGFTSTCYAGRPDPSFQYPLVNGEAAQGEFAGEDCIPFDPNNISVQYVSGRWKIVEGTDHWMFDFDQNEAEARHSFDMIKKYGFNHSCYVGRPDPSFIYLRK